MAYPASGAVAGLAAVALWPCLVVTHAHAQEACDGAVATIVGTAGDDTLLGTGGPDVIGAAGGNDVVSGLGGDDRICAGAGNDRLTGDYRERTFPTDRPIGAGSGDDYLHGGDGADIIYGQGNLLQTSPFLVPFDGGNSTIRGGDGDDTIYGDFQNVDTKGGTIDAMGRQDDIAGGAGTDRVDGDVLSVSGKVTPSAPPATNDRIDEGQWTGRSVSTTVTVATSRAWWRCGVAHEEVGREQPGGGWAGRLGDGVQQVLCRGDADGFGRLCHDGEARADESGPFVVVEADQGQVL